MKSKLLFSIALSAILTLVNAQTKVTFYTNLGNFEAEMHDSIMPITAGNFISLVNSKFYDGIIFHRVISNFVIQGGDPLGTGFGGPGYTIPDEFDSTGILSNVKQTLSMANSGPNTGGSQFFINLKNNTFLDYDKNPTTSAHPIFGIVRTGWNIVDSIAQVPVNSNDKPITDVVMDSVRVTGSFLSMEQLHASAFKTEVYPNPATTESILDVFYEKPTAAEIHVYNQNGQRVHAQKIIVASGKNKVPLRTFGFGSFSPGLYFIEVKTAENVDFYKVIVAE